MMTQQNITSNNHQIPVLKPFPNQASILAMSSANSSRKNHMISSTGDTNHSNDEYVRAKIFKEKYIYPLLAEIALSVKISKMVDYVKILIEILQVIFVVMLIPSIAIWDVDERPVYFSTISSFTQFFHFKTGQYPSEQKNNISANIKSTYSNNRLEQSNYFLLQNQTIFDKYLQRESEIMTNNTSIGYDYIEGKVSSNKKTKNLILNQTISTNKEYNINNNTRHLAMLLESESVKKDKERQSLESSWMIKDNVFQYIFLFIYTIIFFAILSFVIGVYVSKRSFVKWALIVVAYMILVINQIMIIPASALTGYAILFVDKSGGESLSVFFLILSLICTFFLISITCISQRCIMESPYLQSGIFASWDGTVINNMKYNYCFVAFFAPFSNIFYHDWLILIFIIFSLVSQTGNILGCRYMNFLRGVTNLCASWVSAQGFWTQFLAFIRYFVKFSPIYIFTIPILLATVFIVPSAIIVKKNYKKIIKQLTYTHENMTDDEKRELFDFLDFSQKGKKLTLMYLHVGLASHADLMIDFSLLKYLVDNFRDYTILYDAIRIASMFPCEQIFLTYCLNIINSVNEIGYDNNITFYQNFILFQIKRINVIRHSSASEEANSELKTLEKLSDDSIGMIRSFWNEMLCKNQSIKYLDHKESLNLIKNSANSSTFYKIRRKTLETKHAFKDTLEKYPQSAEVMNEYCRFLIEAEGNYIECAKVLQKIQYIEQGKQIHIDHAFKCLVNAFPSYLKDHILNSQGFFIAKSNNNLLDSSNTNTGNKISKFASIANVTLNSTGKYSTLEEKNDDSLDSSVSHGKLRSFFQYALLGIKLRSIARARVLGMIQCIFCIIAMIVLIVVMPETQSTPLSMMRSISYTMNIASSMQYASLICAIQIESITFPNSNIRDNIVKHLAISEEDFPNYPSVFSEPYIELLYLNKNISIMIEKQFQEIFDNFEYHLEELSYLTNFKNYSVPLYALSQTMESKKIKLSFRNAINYYSKRLGSITYSAINISGSQKTLGFSHINDNKILNFNNQTINAQHSNTLGSPPSGLFSLIDEFFEILCNGQLLAQFFYDLYSIIFEKGESTTNEGRDTISLISTIIIVIILVVFLFLRILNTINIHQEFTFFNTIIISIKENEIQESINKKIFLSPKKPLPPLTVGSSSYSQNSSSIFGNLIKQDGKYFIILYLLLYLINALVLVGITLGLGIIYLNHLDYISKSFNWSRDSSQRYLSILNLILGIIIDHSNVAGVFTNNSQEEIFENIIQDIFRLNRQVDLGVVIGNNIDMINFYFIDNIDDNPLIDNEDKKHRINYAKFMAQTSLSNKVNIVSHLYNLLNFKYFDKNSDAFRSPQFYGCVFVIDKYIFLGLQEFQDYLLDSITNRFNEMQLINTLVSILGILAFVFIYILEITFYKMCSDAFEGFKQLILILPTKQILSNHTVFSLLTNNLHGNMNKLVNQKKYMNSINDKIIQGIDKAIINIDINNIIQTINPALQKMTGFTPDQVLGQPITWLIPVPRNKADNLIDISESLFYQNLYEIRERFEMNYENQRAAKRQRLEEEEEEDDGDDVKEEDLIFFDEADQNPVAYAITEIYTSADYSIFSNDSFSSTQSSFEQQENPNIDSEISVDIDESNQEEDINDIKFVKSMIMLLSKEKNKEDYCVTIVLTDITKEQKFKDKMNKIKKETERIMNLIVPEKVIDIVRIRSQRTLFSAEKAVLVYFKIIGIDDYVSSLSPRMIMQYLEKFIEWVQDLILDEHKDLYLIRCDDIFIAVSGLFNEENNCFQNNNNTNTNINLNVDMNAQDQHENIALTENDQQENEKLNKKVDSTSNLNNFDQKEKKLRKNDVLFSINDVSQMVDSAINFCLSCQKIIERMNEQTGINLLLQMVAHCGPLLGFVANSKMPMLEINGGKEEEILLKALNVSEMGNIFLTESLIAESLQKMEFGPDVYEISSDDKMRTEKISSLLKLS